MATANDGHRSRLRQKYIQNGIDGFLDYEIIELLLTFGIPRKDCKPIAKELIVKYKTVGAILNTPPDELIKINGLGPSGIIAIRLYNDLFALKEKEVINSDPDKMHTSEQVAKYLMTKIGHLKQEVFKIICCNTKGGVIDETVTVGLVDSSLTHPREIFKTAIDNRASYIFIAHNHPSGDVTPSDADIYTTRRVVDAGKIIGIEVEDHLIVSTLKYTSMKSEGYI